MHPVLVRIPTPFGEFPIYSYSVMVVLAFLAAFVYVYYEAKRIGEDPDQVVDLAFWAFLFAILGARLLHVIVEWRYYLEQPLAVLKIWEGGLVYYGGFIAAITACAVFILYHRLNFWKWADFWAPVAMITLGVGRIGCLLNGCCYGRAAPHLPWAITYPPGRLPLPLDGVPVHPAPIYEALAALLLAAFLIGLERRPHRPGVVVWAMALGYAVARFFLEFLRADPRGEVAALGLSTSQTIAIAAVAAAVPGLIWTFRRDQTKLES